MAASKTIGFIGGGKIAQAMAKGFIAAGMYLYMPYMRISIRAIGLWKWDGSHFQKYFKN